MNDTGYWFAQLRKERDALEAERDALKARAKELEAIVNEQAEDPRLWFVALSITESTLQHELRRLHAAIEGKSPEQCAVEALDQ